MVISDKYKFIFILMWRTASRATKEALLQIPGTKTIGRLKHYYKVPIDKKTHFLFCGVRNPYSRILSCYLHSVKTKERGVYGLNFAEYVAGMSGEKPERYANLPIIQVTKNNGLKINHYIKFEDLPHSLHAVPNLRNLNLKLNVIGKSSAYTSLSR